MSTEIKAGSTVQLKGFKNVTMTVMSVSNGILEEKKAARCVWMNINFELQDSVFPIEALKSVNV